MNEDLRHNVRNRQRMSYFGANTSGGKTIWERLKRFTLLSALALWALLNLIAVIAAGIVLGILSGMIGWIDTVKERKYGPFN